jgi:hypothetical protein
MSDCGSYRDELTKPVRLPQVKQNLTSCRPQPSLLIVFAGALCFRRTKSEQALSAYSAYHIYGSANPGCFFAIFRSNHAPPSA